jgi:hypothetical protein
MTKESLKMSEKRHPIPILHRAFGELLDSGPDGGMRKTRDYLLKELSRAS